MAKKSCLITLLMMVCMAAVQSAPMPALAGKALPVCPPVNYATVPYSCNFGSSSENSNWVLVNGSQTNQWYIGTGTFSGTANVYSLYISSDNGMSNYYTTDTTSVVYAYRDITLSAGQFAYSYDWLSNGENGRDFMRVALVPEILSMTAGTLGQWSATTLPAGALAMDGGSHLDGQSSWQTANDVIDIPSAGNYRIVVLWSNDDRYGYQPPAAIDNITFAQNTCVLPTNLALSNVTSSGATLTWTPGGSETQWSVTVNGVTYTSNTSSYTITGLQPNTEYTVELRSVCGDTSSLAPRRITLHTECGAMQMPYSYSFEDAPMGAGTDMPDCWHRISSSNYPYVVQSNAHTGSRSLYFHTADTQYAVLPAVDAPLNSLHLQLWARSASAVTTPLVVGMMSNPADAATFVPVDTLDSISLMYAQFEVSFEDYAGTGAYPALMVAAGTANYLYVDDIALSACTYTVTETGAFTENFESSSDTRSCWTQEYDNGSVDWTFAAGGHGSHPAAAHGGTLNALLYTSAYGQHTTRLVSPMLVTAGLPAAKFSFWYAQTVWGSDQDRLTVYYRTSSSASWTQLEAFTSNVSAWTYQEYYLPASDSLQVSFMGDARYGYGVVVDDVTIEAAPFCGEVTGLAATLADTASATVQLSWSGSLNSGGYFRIVYGEHGFDPAGSTGTVINNVTSTTYNVAYLPVNKTYDFYVYTICNSQQQSSGVMVSAFVPAMPVRTFPYTCSFSNPADNNQWNLVNGTQTNRWFIGTAVGNDTADPHALYITNTDEGTSNSYSAGTTSVYAYREMVMPAGLYDYTYDWRCNGESTYDYLRVALVRSDVSITAGSNTNWGTTTLPTGAIALDGGSRRNGQSAWQAGQDGSFTIQQPGTYRLVFFWHSDVSVQNQPPAAVDNIIIQRNECGYLSSLTAQGTDTGTIQLSWTGALADSATYTVEYGLAGFSRGTGTMLNNITATSATITGLTANTQYDFYVGISCPSIAFLAPEMATGRTLPIVAPLPLQTTFDTPASNRYWTLLNGTQTNQWFIGSATGENDSSALYISNNNGTSNAYSISNVCHSFAYCTMNLTVDSFAYSYSWKNVGENNYDFIRVALVPESVTLAAGAASGFSRTAVPSGAIALDGGNQLSSHTDWQQQSGVVSIAQAGTYRLVFYWYNDGSAGTQPPAAVDNVTFRRDNCFMPSNLVATHADSTSVTLTWDTLNGTSWRVGYGSSYDTVSVNTATITGLTPGTSYSFNVMTICDAGTSVPATITIRTLCSPMSLPYSYGFEDAAGSGSSRTFNSCWFSGSDVAAATTRPYPYTVAHTGSYSFYTNTSYSTGTHLIVPAVDRPVNEIILTFWARRTSSGSNYGGDLEIGVVDNPYNFASFHKIADIDVEGTTWAEYTVYTDNYSSANGFLCFHSPQGASVFNDIYIDDIVVDTLPDCTEPINLLAAVTDSSARLTWHGIGHNVRWGVEYGPHGFAQGAGTFAYSNDTAYTITGLQQATQYDAYVYTDCNHTASSAVMVTFTTDCGLATVPYTENFDSYQASQTASISPCWYKKYSRNNNLQSYPYPTTTAAQYSGSKALYFYSGSSSYSYAVLPEFGESIDTLQMTLKVYREMGSSLQVGYMSDPADFSTFHSVRSIQPSSQYSWSTYTVPFNTVSGSHLRMAIVAPQGSFSNTMIVDDVQVEYIPACDAPALVTASSVGTNSATVSWTPSQGISAYRVEIGQDGFSEGSGLVVDSVVGSSYTFTGLQPGYTYDVYVSSICANGTGYSASASASFTTICGLASVPYSENFDSYGTTISSQISPCWSKGNGNYGSSYYPYPTSANAQYEGSNSLYFSAGSQSNSYSYAVLPMFSDSLQQLQITFKILRTNTAVLSVGVVPSQSSYSSFQLVSTITPTTSDWETHTVQFNTVSGTNQYICLAARPGTANNRFYIDDITVERIPACNSVASVSLDSISDTRAVISWSAVSGVTEYEVEYGPVGYVAGLGTTISHIAATSVALPGLSASTTYSVSVRAMCSATNRSAATTMTFTTPCVLKTVPYSYGFDDYSSSYGSQSSIACWTQLTNSTSSVYPAPTTQQHYEGTASLRFISNSSTYSCAVLPMFADSVQNLQLTFYARKQNANTPSLVVGVTDDPDDYSRFRAVRTISVAQTQSWEQFTVAFDTVTGSQLWMAIAMPVSSQSGSNYNYVDNIEVTLHQPYSVYLTVADTTRGSVQVSGNATADGRFWPGTSVTLTATPNAGYTFGHWVVGNTANPYTFTMPNNDVHYNNIVFNKEQYNIRALPSVAAGGSITGTGLYDYLDTAVLTAVPAAGYYFAGWTDNSNDNPRSFVVTSDSTFTATFLWGCPPAFASDTVEACGQYTWTATGDTYTVGGTYLHSYVDHNLCNIVDTLRLTIHQSYADSVSHTACDQYAWRGRTLTASGTYYDSLTTASGCDSIYSLRLTLGHSNSYADVQHACDSFAWHGITYFASTSSPVDTLVNASGCDSVVSLNLTLGYSSTVADTHASCGGYGWRGRYYLVSGTYYDSYTNVSGCDSSFVLHLTINQNVSTSLSQTVCDSLVWGGQTYTQSGVYTNHLQSAVGCDSSVTLMLTVNASSHLADTHFACDSYVWHDSTYTASTSAAIYTTTNASGCDSVETLILTLGHNNSYTDVHTACDSYVWHDSTYTSSTTTATYTATNASGCDSVVTLNLTLGHSSSTTENRTVCDSLVWHGNTYTQSGTYTDTLANVSGCDSVVTLQLTVNRSAAVAIADTACDSYTWFGMSCTQSGDYHFRLSTAVGCDSNLTLHLVVYPTAASTDVQFACDSLVWIDGLTYTASTSAPTYTLATIHGCDSVVTLNLTLGHSSSTTESRTVCDSLVWHGITYTQSGIYSDTLTNVSGCDSVTTLQLTVNHSSWVDIADTACDSYTWHGMTYTRSGDYSWRIPTVADCDSMTVLHLVVNSSSHAQVADTACDSYSWSLTGQTYTASGNYDYNGITVAGCDSIITLGLVINYSQLGSIADTACDSYSWHGTEYLHGGNYVFDSVTAEGCTYKEYLALVLNEGTYRAEYMNSCDTLTWNGQQYAQSGTYIYSYTNDAGCPSTDTLHLVIDHHSDTAYSVTACDSYTWNGVNFIQSGVYTYDYSQQGSTCTNVDTLYLTIHQSAHTVDSVTACDSLAWNGATYTYSGIYYFDSVTAYGCDSTAQLVLTVNHATSRTDTAEVCDSYLWMADSVRYDQSGTYYYQTTNQAGCDSNMTLLLSVHRSYGLDGTAAVDSVMACDSLVWHGITYIQSGNYADTLLTAFGCDSVTLLQLELHSSYARTDTVTACDSYTWLDGITYTASTAEPTIAGSTVYGCDSVLQLNLTVNYSSHEVLYQNYCDTFFWHGQAYTQSGEYIFEYVNDSGCASIDTLHLVITTGVDTAYYVDACDGYNWNDSLYTQSGIYTYDYSALGSTCTNVDTLYLTIHHSNSGIDSIQACDSYTWIDGQTYTQSIEGLIYTATNVDGCDSVVTLVLTVNYNTSAAYYDTILQGDTYRWERSGESYTDEGVYTYDYLTDAGCASTDTLYLFVIRPLDTTYYTVRGLVNDTAMGYVVIHPDTLVAEYQAAYLIAVPHEGHRFVQWQDGDTHAVRIIWVVSDTTLTADFEQTVGIQSAEEISFSVWADRTSIHVQGTALANRQVLVYDVTGRRMAVVKAHDEQLVIPAAQWPTGVYFVKVDNAAAQRVVLHR